MSLNEVQADCTGYDLAIGSIFGVRAFRIDRLDRLTALQFAYRWTPGENVAKCLGQQHTDECLAERAKIKASQVGSIGFYFGSVVCPCPAPGDGQALHDDEGCPCGFYAFVEDDERIGDTGAYGPIVLGVIEGYGRTLVGSKGFRCQKARIVGLTIPKGPKRNEKFKQWRRKRQQILADLYDVPVYKGLPDLLVNHPVSEQHAQTRDQDPNFWTRP